MALTKTKKSRKGKKKSQIPMQSSLNGRSFLGQPFFDDVCLTFKYETEFNATATTYLYAYQMLANSLYDPDYTSVGSQPLAYDQWAAFYDRYTVYASEYDVEVIPRTTSSSLVVACAYSVNSTTFAGPDVTAVQRRGQSRGGGQGGPTARLRGGEPVHTTFGVQPFVVEADDNFAAATTASPIRKQFLNINIECGGTSDVFTIKIRLLMKARMWTGVIGTLSLWDRRKLALQHEQWRKEFLKEKSYSEANNALEAKPSTASATFTGGAPCCQCPNGHC